MTGLRAELGGKTFNLGILAPVSLLWLVPARLRWRALLTLEAMTRPIAKLLVPEATYYRDIVPEADERLYRIMERATRVGVLFQPEFTHDSLVTLNDALAKGRGVICVGFHNQLLYAAIRYIFDREVPLLVNALSDHLHFLGTRQTPQYLNRTFNLFPQINKILKHRGIFASMVDHDHGKRVNFVDVLGRALPIRTALLTFAVQTDTPIVFFYATRSARAINIAWGAPGRGRATGDEIALDLGVFLAASIAEGGGEIAGGRLGGIMRRSGRARGL